MRKIVYLVLLIGIWSGVVAQDKSIRLVDKTMRKIPESSTHSVQGLADYINTKFSTQSNKSRAIFIWVVKNIAYDLDSMFVNRTYQTLTEVTDRTLRTKKGICFDFAVIFNEIAHKVGLKSYVILGYTKQNEIADILPHAWCTAFIDSKWFIFDPTWGSGCIRYPWYIKQINNFYYKTKPEKVIDSHMPFDPLWQLSYYPITNLEFCEGKTQLNNKRPFFNFVDSLSVYEKQSNIEQLIASNRRIEKSELVNSLISAHLEHNRKEIAYYKNKDFEDRYDSAVDSFNKGSKMLNQFSEFFNKRHILVMKDADVQQMIVTTEIHLNSARKELVTIKPPDENAALLVRKLNKKLDQISVSLNENKVFLRKYLSTSQQSRIYLFYIWGNQ